MGFLDRLFGRKEAPAPVEAPSAVEEKPFEEVCPHPALRPHWQNAEDMGKPELATSYVCEACGQTFSPEERDRVLAAASEKAHELVEIDESMRKSTEEMLEDEKRG